MPVRPSRLLAFVMSALIAACLATTAHAAVSPATGLNAIVILGEPGAFFLPDGYRDWRGDGIDMTPTAAGGLYTLYTPGGFYLEVAPPAHSTFVTGTYSTTYYASAGTAGLAFSGEGRGCGGQVGQLVVHEVVYDEAGLLATFAATFEATCETAERMGGEIRYNSSVDYAMFGELAAGTHRPHTVTVRATEPTTFGTAAIGGGIETSPKAFVIANDRCSGQTLATDATCTITVEGWATRVGRNLGRLTLPVVGGGPRVVPLDLEGRETAAGGYMSVRPARLLDTRTGNAATKAPIGPGQSINVLVAGRDPVAAPVGVSAVVLNVTATRSTTGGYVTVWPAGRSRPTTSSVNFTRGSTRANLVTVPVSPTGFISIYNAAGSTDVIADVVGYYRSGVRTQQVYGSYFPSEPGRLYDSRATRPLASGYYRGFWFTYPAATDGHIRAVALNITALGATGSGYLSAWDGDERHFPTTSSVNYSRGPTVANMAIVPVIAEYDAASGRTRSTFAIANTGASVNFLIDVLGFYDDNTLTDYRTRFVPLPTPRRIVDTRAGLGTTRLTTGATRRIASGQAVSTPSTLGLVGNATAVQPTASTYLTMWPHGSSRPTVSNLNVSTRQTVANMAMLTLGTAHDFDLYNSTGAVDVLYDVAGTMESYPQKPVLSAPSSGARVSEKRFVTADVVSGGTGDRRLR